MPIPTRCFLALGAFAALVFASGCASHKSEDAFADAVNTGERPVAMAGQASYFGGQIQATVTVSRGVGHGRAAGGKGGGSEGSRGGGWKQDTEGMDSDQEMAYFRARSAIGSPLPPVTLRVKLENLGKDIVAVEIQEVNSDLGNFVVEPSLLSLAPGQNAEPNPMISQLGVTSDDLPVTVTLAVKGKVETEIIHVVSVKNAPGTPPPPPPPTPGT